MVSLLLAGSYCLCLIACSYPLIFSQSPANSFIHSFIHSSVHSLTTACLTFIHNLCHHLPPSWGSVSHLSLPCITLSPNPYRSCLATCLGRLRTSHLSVHLSHRLSVPCLTLSHRLSSPCLTSFHHLSLFYPHLSGLFRRTLLRLCVITCAVARLSPFIRLSSLGRGLIGSRSVSGGH